jgi:hypothetical protein
MHETKNAQPYLLKWCVFLLCLAALGFLAQTVVAQDDDSVTEQTEVETTAEPEAATPYPVEVLPEPTLLPAEVTEQVLVTPKETVLMPTEAPTIVTEVPTEAPTIEMLPEVTEEIPAQMTAEPTETLSADDSAAPSAEPTISAASPLADEVTLPAQEVFESTEAVEPLVLEMTATPSLAAVEVTADVFTPEPIAAPIRMFSLYGHLESSLRLERAIVIVVGVGTAQTTAAQDNGSFALDLLPGSYLITISAAGHLPYRVEVMISEQPLVLPIISLTGGDVNGDQMVNAVDADLIITNFGHSVPFASASTDLNGDGVVNIQDLVAVAVNM